MVSRKHASSVLPLVTLLAVAPACGDDGGASTTEGAGSTGGTGDASASSSGGSTGAADMIDVAIQFSGAVGSKPFSCATTYDNVGTSGSTLDVMDFRFYVHGVELLTKDGAAVPLELTHDGVWQYEDLALIDLEDGSGSCANGSTDLNTKVVGKAPAGDYDGVRFKLGVPFALNHADAAVAPSPLNLTPLFWSWQFGYKFARIDLKSAAQDLWAIHLGSTGCEMDGDNNVTGCMAENRPTVELTGFDPTSKPITVDVLELVKAADVDVNQEGTAPGCMSEPADLDCAPVFTALGLPFGGAQATPQTLFSVR